MDIETADRFLAAVDSTALLLARHPESGTKVFVTRPEIQGIRRFPVAEGFEKILLFYLPRKDGIELVRVVHGSRDLEQLFREGSFG